MIMKNKTIKAHDLTESEKFTLFWASFLALTAASTGFVFRSMVPSLWGNHFQVGDSEVGALFGAGLWPIAIMMILFSFLVDKIGYRISMLLAFGFQALSVVLTIKANSYDALWYACIAAGVGHGIVEACINPLCASIYRDEKSKWLNILHAAWPAGLVLGGVIYLSIFQGAEAWLDVKSVFWWMLLPVAIYGVMFLMMKRYPEDERVENNVSTMDMLREFGGLGFFLAVTFLCYEADNQLGWVEPSQRLNACLLVGALVGLSSGLALKSAGKILFFILCVVMIPLATAEIATDGWIKKLMEPSVGEYAGWALVFSASIMMVLRFFAGIPLKFMSPPTLLLVSSIFSIIGLFALSMSAGTIIFFAFIFYAVGQTFYWPTVLGFVAEQFPKGGAMTLNTVSAMGLLTVGIFGFPFFGAIQDHVNASIISQEQPALVQKIKTENMMLGSDKPIYEKKNFFGIDYEYLNMEGIKKELSSEDTHALQKKIDETTGRETLKVAALLPAIMAVFFVLILMYYRSIGGYRPVVLS
jgi:fucose permease